MPSVQEEEDGPFIVFCSSICSPPVALQRCDGAKPACQQCARAKKTDACEYDDGKGKTRTQILRETVAKLESRIRELEDPDYISSSIALFDPHLHSHSDSSCSSLDSPESSYLSASHSPFPPDASPISESWNLPQGFPSPSSFASSIFGDGTQLPNMPTLELSRMLVDIFAPYNRQCGIELDSTMLRDSLSLPFSEQRHPVLMNAVFLWACFMSRPEPLSQHEEHYLQLALEALPMGLKTSEKIIDVIQASCLLATYFLANGRLIEGNYHASAAAALSNQIGLAKPRPVPPIGTEFKPPKHDKVDGERILTFWHVYNLDRCWSAILRRPLLIPDDDNVSHGIYCPWPQEMAEYKTGLVNAEAAVPTIRAFLSGSVSPSGFSIPALRVKASALFACAESLATRWNAGSEPSAIMDDVQALEHTITLFLSTLIPIDQLDAIVSSNEKSTLLMCHTLAQSAIIHLHRPFATHDPISFTKSSEAAQACVAIIRQIRDQDVRFLEPIIAPCWWSVADILLGNMGNAWAMVDHSTTRTDLETVLYAMSKLRDLFPVVAPAVAKLQKRLS
jgi:hypothetical protein